VRRSRTAGVTLVELVVVLSISSSLCGIAIPGVVGARRAFRAGDAAGRLTLVLRDAQARAQATGARVRVEVDGSGRFSVVAGADAGRIAGGELGAAVVSNYPGGVVEFGSGGLPTTAGGTSPRAGHFAVGAGPAVRNVVLQLGGCVRCM
jgi:type II secretory pathway pseudopilin PulG